MEINSFALEPYVFLKVWHTWRRSSCMILGLEVKNFLTVFAKRFANIFILKLVKKILA